MATASSLTGLEILNAFDSVAASQTDSVLVAGIANSKIRVVGFVLNQGDTTPSPVTFNSKGSGAGTAISPAWKGSPNGGFVVPALSAKSSSGWFETKRGEALTVTTGVGSTTGIMVVFRIIPIP